MWLVKNRSLNVSHNITIFANNFWKRHLANFLKLGFTESVFFQKWFCWRFIFESFLKVGPKPLTYLRGRDPMAERGLLTRKSQSGGSLPGSPRLESQLWLHMRSHFNMYVVFICLFIAADHVNVVSTYSCTCTHIV